MTPDAPSSPHPEAAPPTRLVDQCPGCGYSLAGSPDVGICPECGGPYDQSMIVLHGAARGQFANLGNATLRKAIWELVWLVMFLAYMGNTVGFDARNPVLLIIAAYCVALTALALTRRFLSDRPGLVQVYLRPDGFLQRDHDDRSLMFTLNKVTPKVAAVVLMSLGCLTFRSFVGFALGVLGLILAGLIVGGALAYHFVAHRPGRPPAPLEVFGLWRRSWREADELLFKPSGPSAFRLRLREKANWHRSVRYLADAEVTCTPEQAARLQALITGWMSAARERARKRNAPATRS